MKNIKCGSSDYKKALAEFVKEEWNKTFTYNQFVHWMMNKQCKLSSATGHREHEQAIFDSTLNHEYHVVKSYRKRTNHMETLFTVQA